jgi:cytochrome b561
MLEDLERTQVTETAIPTRYGAVTQTFHWLTVFLVGAAYLLGEGGPESRVYAAERAVQLGLHETFGMAVFVVLILRLVWRFFDRVPEVPMQAWMRVSSHILHGVLYALLAAIPLTAIFGAWVGGHAITPFGIEISPFATVNTELGHTLSELHETLGNAIIWVAGFHAAAALYHHFFLRDRVLVAMLPFGETHSASTHVEGRRA